MTVELPLRWVTTAFAVLCWLVVALFIQQGEGSHPTATVFGLGAGITSVMAFQMLNDEHEWVEFV